jgi:RNA polymerase sigma factor (sigma-70 family)
MAPEGANLKNIGSGHDHQPPGLESFAPALRRYFAKRVPRSEVEDLVQEVLVKMLSRRREAEIVNLEGYIFTVARHVLRESRPDQGLVDDFDEATANIPDADPTPDRIVSGRIKMARLLEAIKQLPPRTREVFVAHRFEEMTYGAIGSLLGISVSAVEKHIMAALKSLSASLDGAD